MSSSALHERLGVDLQDDIALDARLAMLATCLEGGIDAQAVKRFTLACRQQVLLGHYLLEQTDKVREHAAALVYEVEDFLLGDWPGSYEVTRWVDDRSYEGGGYKRVFLAGRAWCRQEFHWMEIFRDGLLWALWLRDENAARRIAQYPGEDVPEREFDFAPADKGWRMLAASLILRRGRIDWPAHEQAIERSRSRKARLLLAALRAIATANGAEFRKAITECVRQHLRTEFPNRGLDNKLALDASLLIQVARLTGMPIELKPADRDHLVDRDEG
jgi:hypothetical protein